MKLSAILDREFRILEAYGKGPFPTVQSQAVYFGMEQTYLSKLRSQSQSLSRAKAQLMASRLREGQPPSKVAELVEEMFQTDRPPAKFEQELEEWFQERAAKKEIMIVEFLEPPVVGPFRPDLAKIVGSAVAKGLNYAMLFPVNMKTIQSQPSAIMGYFISLWLQLTETYRNVLEHALDEKQSELESNGTLSKTERDTQLKDVENRLRLYQLADGGWSECPTLGVRLFYTEHSERAHEERVMSEQNLGQLWNWISTKHFEQKGMEQTRHEILHKDASPELIRATTIRYCPILDFWRENSNLPLNQDDLGSFVTNAVDVAPHNTSADLLVKRWSVVEPSKNILRKAISDLDKKYENKNS
jgi:hypothetical protein